LGGGQADLPKREREREKSVQWMGTFSQLGKCENGGKRQKQAE